MHVSQYRFFIFAFAPTSSGSAWVSLPCGLPHAVPPSNRINITVGSFTGPIGIVGGNWESATSMSEVTKILLEERVGYNAIISGSTDSSIANVRMLGNCQDPGASNPNCDNPSSTSSHHITLEVWDIYPEELVDLNTRQMGMAPKNHGSIGYTGLEGLYVEERIHTEVYEATGISLSYYRNWNRSWNSFSTYFARYTDIQVSDLDACKDTKMNLGSTWLHHVNYTQDTGGVEMVDGVAIGRCEGGLSGHWWFGPACRTQPTHCIPILTAGGGWGLSVLAQQGAAYNIPIAIAIANVQSAYFSLPRQHRLLLYWWKPDATFVDLHPQIVVFPETDNKARRAGDYRTQNAAVSLLKFTHYSLGTDAARAHDFVANMHMPMVNIEDILRLQLAGASVTGAACQWLKRNVATWDPWIPAATICKVGNGIVNAKGDFVIDREDASACQKCSPGKSSNRTADGLSYACVDCPQGKTSQYMSEVCSNCTVGRFAPLAGASSCQKAPIGSHVPLPGAAQSTPCGKGSYVGTTGVSECMECNAGEFADVFGSSECIRCTVGRFAMTSGQSECVECDSPHTSTLGMGSRSEAECLCHAGMYRSGANATGICQTCPSQMSCSQGATERSLVNLLLHGQPCLQPFAEIAEPYPVLIKGFWSGKPKPFFIYKCWNENRCPGGPPGQCPPNMDLSKLSCSHCRTDYHWDGRKCEKCPDVDRSAFIFPGLIFVVAIVVIIAMYELIKEPMSEWNSWYNSCCVIAFLVFNHYQILTLLSKANVEVPDTFSDTTDFWRFTSNVLLVFNLECAGYGEFRSFVIAQSLTPIFFFLCVVFVIGAYWILLKMFKTEQITLDLSRMQNVFFSVLFTYFIGIASMSMTLFQCRENPNGDLSLSRDLNITCYKSDWNEMLVVAIFAVLLYCVAMGALFAWVLLKIEREPYLLNDLGFQHRWKFLLVKFNPDARWWPLVFLIRGVLLNLSFVVFAEGIKQLFFFLSVEIIYVLLTILFVPWRFRSANCCSIFIDACVVYTTTFPMLYAEVDWTMHNELARFGAAISFLPLFVGAVIVATIIAENISLKKVQLPTNPCGDFEEAFEVLACCLKADCDQRGRLISGLSDWDKWHLRKACEALAQCISSPLMLKESGMKISLMSPQSSLENNKKKVAEIKVQHHAWQLPGSTQPGMVSENRLPSSPTHKVPEALAPELAPQAEMQAVLEFDYECEVSGETVIVG